MADDEQGAPPDNHPQDAPRTPDAPDAEIDVAQLADKVYRLLLADLRLALARGGRLPATDRGRS